MYLLDTNIISELLIKEPNQGVAEWIFANEDASKTSVITVAALLYGAKILPDGKRKVQLLAEIRSLISFFSDNILQFDNYSADIYSSFRAEAQSKGRTLTVEDGIIAAIAKANALTLATRNTKDFDFLSIKVINPFEAK